MKRHILIGIGILSTLSFLVSCVTIGAVVETQHDGTINQAGVAGSLGPKGFTGTAGTSTSSPEAGTTFTLLTSDKSSEDHAMIQDQLLQYRNVENKNQTWENYLKTSRRYNESLAKENTNLQKDIAQLKNDKKIARVRLIQAEARREGLKQVSAQLKDSLRKKSGLAQSQKNELQGMLRNLDQQNKILDEIIIELKDISESEPATVGGT